MSYTNAGNLDMHKVAVAVETSSEDNEMFRILQHGIFHQIQDKVTRRIGKLTKMIRLIDIRGVNCKDIRLDFVKRDDAASKLVKDCYPELLGTSYFVNYPGWVSAVWSIIRHFSPKRAVEKCTLLESIQLERMLNITGRTFQISICLNSLGEVTQLGHALMILP